MFRSQGVAALALIVVQLFVGAAPLSAQNPLRICSVVFKSIVRSIDRHFLDRPAFVETHRVPDPDAQPNTSIYIETRYIKHLRDKAHLSPLQVDRMIQLIKRLLYEEIANAQFEPLWMANDYKSIRLVVNRFDPQKMESIYARGLSKFEHEIDQVLSPDELEGRSALAILRSIPEYKAPFAVGVGLTMNEAGIAARTSYKGGDQPAGPFIEYTSVSASLYEHAQSIEQDRLKVMTELKRQLSPEEFGSMTVEIKGATVFSPAFNDLMRKISDPAELAERSRAVFGFDKPFSVTVGRDLLRYYGSIRVFEPPLEYRTSEVIDPRGLNSESAFDADLLLSRTDYVASIDLRRVGAHHATVIQASLVEASVLKPGDFDRWIQSLSYGDSQTRYFELIAESEALLSRVFFESENVGAKTSGDEVTRFLRGPYHSQMATEVLSRMNADMRATVVDVKGFRGRGLVMTEDRINEYRHLGETIAKVLHDEISLTVGSRLADQVRLLVEIVPAREGDPKNFVALIAYRVSDPAHQDRIGSQILRFLGGMPQLLIERGIPEGLAMRLKDQRIVASAH